MACRRAIRALLLLLAVQLNYGTSWAQAWYPPRPPQVEITAHSSQGVVSPQSRPQPRPPPPQYRPPPPQYRPPPPQYRPPQPQYRPPPPQYRPPPPQYRPPPPQYRPPPPQYRPRPPQYRPPPPQYRPRPPAPPPPSAPARPPPPRPKNPIIKLTAGPIRVVDHVDYERLKAAGLARRQWEEESDDLYRVGAWPEQHRADVVRALHDGPPFDGHSMPPLADRSIYDDYSARNLNAADGPSVAYRDLLSLDDQSPGDDLGLPRSTSVFLRNKWLFPFVFHADEGSTIPKSTHTSHHDAVRTKHHHKLHHLPLSEETHDKYSLDEEAETIDKCPRGTMLSAHGHCVPINAADHENSIAKTGVKRERYENDLDDYDDDDDDDDDDSSESATWQKDHHGRSTKNCPLGMELFAGRCREIF